MRVMQWLHRWVSLILVIQVLLWLVSGLYFALAGNASMSGQQYRASELSSPALSRISPRYAMNDVRARYPMATAIRLRSIAGRGQYQIILPDNTVYLDARTGTPWQTSKALATQLALNSYTGPGEVDTVEAVTGSDEVYGWTAPGYRVALDDDLNTRIYIERTSGEVRAHRNTPWVLGDWAFRLHFMDFSGGHNFNHLLIWTAGLLALWFSLSGFILLLRSLARGELSPRRKQTWLEHFQQQGRPLPSGCGGGGSCGLCKVTMTGAAIPAPSTAGRALLADAEIASGIRLSCQHKVTTDYTATPLDDDAGKYLLTLIRANELSPSIVELTFTSDSAICYQAGQFMQFVIPTTGKPLLRHYSMATRPQPNRCVFAVRRMPAPRTGIPPGVGSDYLCNLKQGDEIAATGPFGDFQLTANAGRVQLFIGGGAGVAPLRALLQTELAAKEPRECVFFYGARNEQELCYHQEFTQQAGLSYTPVLSESDPSEAWRGRTGLVHKAAQEWLKEWCDTQPASTIDVYVCGPPPMLKATLAMLSDAGIAADNIRYDDFGI